VVADSSRGWSYDSADRLQTSGTGYDALGRTSSVAATDTAGGEIALEVGYYVNDMVRRIVQGEMEATYTLDVSGGRFRSVGIDSPGGVSVRTYHYANDEDSPAWTDEGGWYSRVVFGLGGIAGIYQSQAGATDWKITSLHGDFVGTVAGADAGLTATHESDEYGRPRSGPPERYGWLGAAQRAADNPGDLIAMGVRLYNPALGRFLSSDPVYGGNANSYEYATADPINKYDVSGEASCWRTSLSSRKWYYWWGKWGGYRVDWNWRCYYSNSDMKYINRIGVAYLIIGALSWAYPPLAAAFVVAGVVTMWLYWEYSEACTRRRGVYFSGYFRWYLDRLWRYQWGWGWITRISCA
jgi:RHS repeat-associated protein